MVIITRCICSQPQISFSLYIGPLPYQAEYESMHAVADYHIFFCMKILMQVAYGLTGYSWRVSISVSPNTKTQTKTYKKQKYRAIHYQNEVEKCDLIRRLKLDIEELETKLEGSDMGYANAGVSTNGPQFIHL